MPNQYERHKKYLQTNQFRWLITGVAGFIGSNLLEELLRLNQLVIGIDNFSTGFSHNIDMAIADSGTDGSNFKFIEADINDYAVCEEAITGVDYILHQAALGSIPRSIDDPIATNATNIGGFLNVLTSAKNSSVKRMVYAASSSTYGDSEDLPKVENKIGKPLSPYALTKYVNEVYAQVFSTIYGFNTIGLRYFNIFGKRQSADGDYAAVIPVWVKAILNGKSPVVNGDGSTSRDFCYVDNAVQMNILAALSVDITESQVYNVALNSRTSLSSLLTMIKENILLIDANIKIKPEKYLDFRQGDVRHSQADITKAIVNLGYDPKFKVTDGIKNTMRWYYDNL